MVNEKIIGILISMIRFEDNMVLLYTSENDLKIELIGINDILLTFKIKINTVKTKVIVCSK